MHPTEARADWREWRTAVATNYFDADPHFQRQLAHYGRGHATKGLRHFGEVVVGLDALVIENNRDENLPRLRKYGPQGERIEAVEFHPTYAEIGRAAYATGLMGLYAEPGHELETLAYTYLFSQNGEAGHACPIACTAGMIKILQAADGVPSEWFGRLYNPDYDEHFHGAQFLTEAQGGSDVGANAVVARQEADGWRLTGEKWFCSVIDAHLFLVTARPEGGRPGTGGLMAFAVPRERDGALNGFSIRRLKYKLGTRSMASAEVDFEGAWGIPVGDFKAVVGIVLNTSRLYNAVCSSAAMQRAFREAHAYARARKAFGQPILEFPGVARIVARLHTEAWAARALTFHLGHLADEISLGRASEADAAAWRMLVNLNKFWTSCAGTSCVRDAIEVLGGNGAIEEFSVLPRLLRDGIVCEAWEGGHNVLVAQVVRDAARFGFHRPMFERLARLGGDARLEAVRARFERLLELPEAEASWIARDVLTELRGPAVAAVLRSEASSDDARTTRVRAAVIEQLLCETDRHWDPAEDRGLPERVRILVA